LDLENKYNFMGTVKFLHFNAMIAPCIRVNFLILLIFASVHATHGQSIKSKSFLVCGDSKVHLVDYDKSQDSIPAIVWTWDSKLANDLPEVFRERKFRSMDDCKPINNGKQLIVSSSSGAIAIVNISDKKVVFFAEVGNAHSVEMLPGNLLAAAASVHATGNKIMLFDVSDPSGKPFFTDSLYSAHGLVWNAKRKSLYALGYDEIREYKLIGKQGLSLKEKWTIPGISGHELRPTADADHLFVTEHGGSWVFDLDGHQFKKIPNFPDAENIKSLGQNKSGQYLFTVPEESWWTYHVRLHNPERSFAFPGMKVYKARWFSN
jgi:hypothetical protein